jgi:hypothetical protein
MTIFSPKFISEIIRDKGNLLTYYWKISIQRKIIHQNWMKNKNSITCKHVVQLDYTHTVEIKLSITDEFLVSE